MPYKRKARRSRAAAKPGGCECRMPEGVMLVAGRGGSKDAAYAFASVYHKSAQEEKKNERGQYAYTVNI